MQPELSSGGPECSDSTVKVIYVTGNMKPLPHPFAYAQAQPEEFLRHWQQLGIPLTTEDLLFSRPDGRGIHPDSLSKACISLALKAGLKNVHLHSLRHTQASLLIQQGVHPKVVQERLGHAKVATTMDVYSHVVPSLQQKAVQKFDLALETAEPSPHLA